MQGISLAQIWTLECRGVQAGYLYGLSRLDLEAIQPGYHRVKPKLVGLGAQWYGVMYNFYSVQMGGIVQTSLGRGWHMHEMNSLHQKDDAWEEKVSALPSYCSLHTAMMPKLTGDSRFVEPGYAHSSAQVWRKCGSKVVRSSTLRSVTT